MRYLLILLLFVSCMGEKKIDASNENTTAKSIEEIKKELPEEKRKKFEDSLKVLAFSGLDISTLLKGGVGVEAFKKKAMEKVHGKTANEIIAEGEKIFAERRKRELEQAKKEITELEQKKIKAESAKKSLAKIKVIKSRFYQKKEMFGKKPIISLKVKNNTKESLSRIYFRGTLATPSRKVPWLVKEFNYNVSGGIEPGETQEWNLAPNQFSEWGTVEIKDGAVFTVEVISASDHKKNELYSSRNFGEKEAKRLDSLRRKIASE